MEKRATEEGRLKAKIVLCGDGGVGKTTLVHAFVHGRPPRNTKLTVGVQHFVKEVEVDSRRIKLVIWDLGGEQRFRLLAPIFLRGAKGAIFVFDITDPGTFERLDDWLKTVLEHVGDVPRVLVGNKVDLEQMRLVDRGLAEDYARRRGFIGYVETSAKQGLRVEQPFFMLARHIIGRCAEASEGRDRGLARALLGAPQGRPLAAQGCRPGDPRGDQACR